VHLHLPNMAGNVLTPALSFVRRCTLKAGNIIASIEEGDQQSYLPISDLDCAIDSSWYQITNS
jgi:hypothetical protein